MSTAELKARRDALEKEWSALVDKANDARRAWAVAEEAEARKWGELVWLRELLHQVADAREANKQLPEGVTP